MIILELIVWMVKFIWISIVEVLKTPFILLSGAPREEKVIAVKQALFSVPILGGAYLMAVGHLLGGACLTLGTMVLGTLLIKDDGTL
jgi:hypothetical protein